METLLKPGDMIRIRSDIQEDVNYCMKLDIENKNSWVDSMAGPGDLVTIIRITNDGQYITDYSDDDECGIEDYWLYTDEMFDPELISLLLE
jgi:hypothetical protein